MGLIQDTNDILIEELEKKRAEKKAKDEAKEEMEKEEKRKKNPLL